MPVTDTSRLAYKVNKPVLMTDKMRVFSYIHKHPGPMVTRSVIATMLGLTPNNCSGRVNELLADGVIEVHGKVKCPITGSTVQALRIVVQGKLFCDS